MRSHTVSIDTILASLKKLKEWFYYGLDRHGFVMYIHADDHAAATMVPEAKYSYTAIWRIHDENSLYLCLLELYILNKLVDPEAIEGLLETYSIEEEELMAY